MRLIPQAAPFFLCDVLFMKRNRGDADADQFSKFSRAQFAYGLNASIKGASRTARRLIKTNYFLSSEKEASASFLRDVDAVIAGDREGWIAPHERD